MSQLAEIEARLLPMESLIDKLGGDLSQSLKHVESVPTEACNNNGKIVQELLYDFWRRLEIKGSPHHKNIEELLTQVRRVVEERGVEMPRRIYDKIRSVQATRNRATHLAPEETTVDDAIESLKQLGDIAAWYFFKYLGEAPVEPAEPEPIESAPAPVAQALLRIAILYKRKTSDEDVIGHQDEQVLHWLETQFRAAGYSVFIDRHLVIGEQWAKEIARQIRESDIVVPLLSEKSIESDMLSYEVKLAHEARQSQNGKPRLLPVRVKFTGKLPGEMAAIMDSLQYFLWEGPQDNQRLIDNFSRAFLNPSSSPSSLPRLKLEQEGGAVPLDSQFYVVRPVDNEFYQAIGRRDSILLLKGARQMGKTSLLSRALEQARGSGFRVAITDFQKLDASQLESVESFLQALGAMIAIQLDLDVFPQDVWKRQLGAKENFERYLRREVLAKAESPLVWAMDEVDRLFACPFGSDVCGLFRSWWNARAYEPAGPWFKLTLAIVYATEAHLFITDMNQSPFNVGTRFELGDFTFEQVADLNDRYGSPLPDEARRSRFFRLIGGQPYLTRRGLREMADKKLDINALEEIGDRDEGPFGDHLRRILVAISEHEEMADAVREVLRGKACPDQTVFYRLRSGGILAGESLRDARLRCQLYANYLERHLL